MNTTSLAQIPSIFTFSDLPVRVVIQDGEPWFVLGDVCRVLGLGSTAKVAERLRDSQKGVSEIHTPGGRQSMTVISEPGLYRAVLRSNSPEAEPFQVWVEEDVLPTIRKTGGYGVPQTKAEALQLAADLERERERLVAENAALLPQAQQYQALMAADGTYSVSDAAKILGTGELRLFALLRQRGILMDKVRSGAEHHNMPYQQFIDRGYFTVKTGTRPSGETSKPTQTTRVTPKGLLWLERSMRQQQLLPARPGQQLQAVNA